MPGIIRDPRPNMITNPKEHKYGVVQFKGQFYAYEKTKINGLRYLPAGCQLNFNDSEIVPLDLHEQFNWGNEAYPFYITHKVTGVTFDSESNQGPVINEMVKLMHLMDKKVHFPADSEIGSH